MQSYDYQGWQFQRRDDGSMEIIPQSENQASKTDFTAPEDGQGHTLTVPKDELLRLVSFSLVGNVDATVIEQIQNLGRERSTV